MPTNKKNIYLDYAATTPLDAKVRLAMQPFFHKNFGNPSSLHKIGEAANQAVTQARGKIAELLHCRPTEITFTASGTESINLALQGSVATQKKRPGHIITSNIEHLSVLNTTKFLAKNGQPVTYLQPDSTGLINLNQIIKALRPNTFLISIMSANNEIGTIEPIAEIGRWLKRKRPKIIFHTDACQATGSLFLNIPKLHVDLLTLNGHKIYGPKGIGLLYHRSGLKLNPLIYGGGQENNFRSGTENVPAIIGLAKALELVEAKKITETKRLTKLRDYFIKQITGQLPQAILYGHPTKRLANNISFGFPKIDSELLLFHLDKEGIMAANGSACSSNHGGHSHVISAITKQKNRDHIRFTLGRHTTKPDLDLTAQTVIRLVKKLTPKK